MYNWITVLYTQNLHNIVNQLYFNKKNFKKQTKKHCNLSQRELSSVDLLLTSLPVLVDKCDDSFVHRDCISCCPPTCTFEKQCLGSNLHCLDGCYCPDGKCFVKETVSALIVTSTLWSKTHVFVSSLGMLGLLQIFSPFRIWSLKWL